MNPFPTQCYIQLSTRESACSVVVARALVAPQVLDSTPRGSEFRFGGVIPVNNEVPGFNGVCAFSDRRRFRRQRGVCAVNLEDLPRIYTLEIFAAMYCC
jgi:hypothetical protein